MPRGIERRLQALERIHRRRGAVLAVILCVGLTDDQLRGYVENVMAGLPMPSSVVIVDR